MKEFRRRMIVFVIFATCSLIVFKFMTSVESRSSFILKEEDPIQKNQFGCILYLMTSPLYTDEIRSSIILMDYYFNSPSVPVENGPNKKPYDYIIFHTPNVKEAHKDIIQKSTKVVIKWVIWQLNFPELIQKKLNKVGLTKTVWPTNFGKLDRWLRENNLHGATCAGHEWPVGYLMMNRFFSFQMYQQPILKNYKYYMRVDADSFLSDVWKKDPFLELDHQNATFIWRDVYGPNPHDPESCVRNMKQLAVDYFQRMYDNQILPQEFWDDNQRGEIDPRAIITRKGLENVKNLIEGYKWEGNFGAGRLSFFRSSNYLGLAQNLNEELDGIFRNRWGDQAIYPLGVFAYEHSIVKGWRDTELPISHGVIPICKANACKSAQETPWEDRLMEQFSLARR
eukprot:TRINITY_DN7195_c0_g1_i2.p1 TRINITY_DN7195_c0_g1~~TRINITY_DN7195_c0_g1_i2.p1  ORF type:complete len:396 (+),score=61.57 TRINITY_DN7195_c0_g1_i2:185-1372(+)